MRSVVERNVVLRRMTVQQHLRGYQHKHVLKDVMVPSRRPLYRDRVVAFPRSLLLSRCMYTYSMVQSLSWAANWLEASLEIPRISRNPKVHYRTHKRPPPVSILGQPNPVHIPTSHLLEIDLIISTHLHLGLPSGLFPSGFPTKTPYTPSLHTRTSNMPSPSHSSRFYHPHNIRWGVNII